MIPHAQKLDFIWGLPLPFFCFTVYSSIYPWFSSDLCRWYHIAVILVENTLGYYISCRVPPKTSCHFHLEPSHIWQNARGLQRKCAACDDFGPWNISLKSFSYRFVSQPAETQQTFSCPLYDFYYSRGVLLFWFKYSIPPYDVFRATIVDFSYIFSAIWTWVWYEITKYTVKCCAV